MRFKSVLLTCWIICLGVNSSWAQEPDWSLYDRLLAEHVSQKTVDGLSLGWVDYSGLLKNESFDTLVEQLARFDPKQLQDAQQRLAFYINAYNILAINVVLRHWPLASIKEAGAWYRPVWKIEAGKIGGESVTLDQIEHQILRNYGEPRIHFAIVCASLSCPDLLNQSYRSQRLDQQLDQQVKAFLRNAGKGIKQQGEGVAVSRIFDWFEDDFKVRGGVENFIRSYQPLTVPVDAYLPYDWGLNGS